MPKIQRILFPVDFSDSCVGTARYVEFFAGEFEAEVMLIHAIDMAEHWMPEQLLAVRKAKLDTWLIDEMKFFRNTRVCEVAPVNDAASVVLKAAYSWKPDLVMMPTHGFGFFRRNLIGSVTAKILHDLECPVWTSVHAETAPALEQIHCRRILCAMDRSERNIEVLEYAAGLATEFSGELGIVHATTPVDESAAVWHLGEEYNRIVADEMRARITRLQAQTGTQATVFIEPGSPGSVISGVAAEFHADLVVIGRHEPGGLGELFQNACSIVRSAPCPVISV